MLIGEVVLFKRKRHNKLGGFSIILKLKKEIPCSDGNCKWYKEKYRGRCRRCTGVLYSGQVLWSRGIINIETFTKGQSRMAGFLCKRLTEAELTTHLL